MNSKHKKTLKSFFSNPVSSSQWKDIEKLLIAIGCTVSEGRGPRVRFKKNNIFAVFHRPHPEKETQRGAVLSVRDYLTKIGEMP